MTRPKKQTVDYFPHSCSHGKTMFIIEERYGNDGYAFWFKLLEMLGTSEGHVIDLNNPANAEYLRSKTRRNAEQVTEMLDLLATLEAIDRELWAEKVVWCQKFVDGVSDVYTRSRHTEIPRKPDNYAEKPREEGQSTTENPQSRVKESRVKKSKVYGEFKNVTLTEKELEALKTRFGEQGATDWIAELSIAKASKGYKSKSDYATILSWDRRRKRQDGGNHGSTPANSSQSPRPGSKDYVYHDPPGSDSAVEGSTG
jgi:hypothetical protein